MVAKPSKAQLQALQTVRQAEEDDVICSPAGYRKRINHRTYMAILFEKWIEDYYLPNVFGCCIRLTLTGRDILEQFDSNKM
jgi:hypothetical protein